MTTGSHRRWTSVNATSTAKRRDDTPRVPRETTEVRVWLRLLACSTLVLARLRHNLRVEFGLTLPVFDILVQIDRPPRGPTMGELSKRLMVSKGNVTDLVERLERKGLVARRTDADDGRVQHVFLSARAKTLLDRVIPAHDAWIREAMQSLDRDSLGGLERGLGRLKDALRETEAEPRKPRRSTTKAPRAGARARGET